MQSKQLSRKAKSDIYWNRVRRIAKKENVTIAEARQLDQLTFGERLERRRGRLIRNLFRREDPETGQPTGPWIDEVTGKFVDQSKVRSRLSTARYQLTLEVLQQHLKVTYRQAQRIVSEVYEGDHRQALIDIYF